MKIAVAQTRLVKGAVSDNIEAHRKFIDLALTLHAAAVFFPELSLTGYEPELAHELATNEHDRRLDIFQDISGRRNIIIGLGLPTRTESGIRISMIILEPDQPRQTYSKQLLHSDELPYFENGFGQAIIAAGRAKIAPAICYESLQPAHAENAFRLGANVYLASVAKSEHGVEKALKQFPAIARQFAMPVLMANCAGFCDNFLSAGKSSVWTKDGTLAGQLDGTTEGIF